MGATVEPVPSAWLQTGCELIREAGAGALRHFRPPGGIPAENKQPDGDFDPVTAADLETERLLRERLTAHFPNHGIVGEEFRDTPGDSDYSWVIDPVDGTRAFVCGVPVWGVLLGLLHRGEPVAGFAFYPFSDELFYGSGAAAWLVHLGREQPLHTRTTKSLSEALLTSTAQETLLAGCAPHPPTRLTEQVRLVRYGLDSYGYCLLALGQLDIVVEGLLHPYDILPLAPIVRGAGGTLSWEPTDDGRLRAIATSTAALHGRARAVLA